MISKPNVLTIRTDADTIEALKQYAREQSVTKKANINMSDVVRNAIAALLNAETKGEN